MVATILSISGIIVKSVVAAAARSLLVAIRISPLTPALSPGREDVDLVAFTYRHGGAADVAEILAVEQHAPHRLDCVGGLSREPRSAAGINLFARLPLDVEDLAARLGEVIEEF